MIIKTRKKKKNHLEHPLFHWVLVFNFLCSSSIWLLSFLSLSKTFPTFNFCQKLLSVQFIVLSMVFVCFFFLIFYLANESLYFDLIINIIMVLYISCRIIFQHYEIEKITNAMKITFS